MTPKYLMLVLVFALISTQEVAAQDVTYRVKPRDTLFKISRDVLGDQTRWQELCDFNATLIGGQCGYVQAGIDLKLPPPRSVVISSSSANEYTIDMSGSGGGMIAANSGYNVSLVDGIARLSGHSDNPSSTGFTGGIYFRLPDAVEKAASGNRLRIRFVVKAVSERMFEAAYSTADVGNSGWTSLPVSADETTASFEYDVPELNNGNGDFIGLLPDPKNDGVQLELRSVIVTVLPG